MKFLLCVLLLISVQFAAQAPVNKVRPGFQPDMLSGKANREDHPQLGNTQKPQIQTDPATNRALNQTPGSQVEMQSEAGVYFDPDMEINPEEVKFIARQMLDTSLVWGVFEMPAYDSPPRELQSGITPESQKEYSEIMIMNNLAKLNTISPMKGDFESVIFLKLTSFEIHRPEPQQLLSYPGTQWFLILKKGYDNEGAPQQKWTKEITNRKAGKFLNTRTAFELSDPYHGTVCLKWNPQYRELAWLPKASEAFTPDMIKITNWLKSLPANRQSVQLQQNVSKLSSELKDEMAKAVLRELGTLLAQEE